MHSSQLTNFTSLTHESLWTLAVVGINLIDAYTLIGTWLT